MILSIYLTLIGGLNNALRGGGHYNRLIFAFIFGFCVALHTMNIYVGFYHMVAIYFVWAFGWGKYFMAVHGENKRNEKEFWPADIILDSIEHFTILPNKLFGAIGMSLRMLIAGFPLYGILFYAGADIKSWLMVLALTASGLVYYLAGVVLPKHAVRLAEFVMGALVMGALVW